MSPDLRPPFHTNTFFLELKSASAAKYLGVTISDDISWAMHIANITKKANFLKRNIKPHKQNLKSTAYKSLIRPQLEYASTVWSPHTAADAYKIESVQRRAARWTCHDYLQISSVTKMLGDLHWRPLNQRRIDSRLVIIDLVAIPASEFLIPNRREYKFIHPLAYQQIPTSTNYYKYSFFPRTIIHWKALLACIVTLRDVSYNARWFWTTICYRPMTTAYLCWTTGNGFLDDRFRVLDDSGKGQHT